MSFVKALVVAFMLVSSAIRLSQQICFRSLSSQSETQFCQDLHTYSKCDEEQANAFEKEWSRVNPERRELESPLLHEADFDRDQLTLLPEECRWAAKAVYL